MYHRSVAYLSELGDLLRRNRTLLGVWYWLLKVVLCCDGDYKSEATEKGVWSRRGITTSLVSTMSPNDLEQSQPLSMPRFQFTTTRTASSRFSPRTGNINFAKTLIDTPTSLTSTSRGVVPHLTRDHVVLSPSIKWVHVPFEILYGFTLGFVFG